MLLAAVLILQVVADTGRVRMPADSGRMAQTAEEGRVREPARSRVTAQHLATAFRTPAARALLLTARDARMRQDSALLAYDVRTYERVAVGLSVTAVGRERPLYTHEDAARVRWRRDAGAVVDVTGARTVSPDPDDVDSDLDGRVLSPVPYQPGREELMFFNGGRLRQDVDERQIVHPLATGAEAYYTYELGDSTAMRLPGGTVVLLRELKVRPREARWNVAVGSLWFDAASGQLVRAGFRLAVPMDIWEVAEAEEPDAREDVPAVINPLLEPATASVNAIGVEYGLYQGRFWLPRARIAEGSGRMGFMRASFRFEQKFTYNSVNAAPDPRDPIPDVPPARPRVETDTMSAARKAQYQDSVQVARRASRDSIAQGLKARRGACLPGQQTRTQASSSDGIRMLVRVPCDEAALARSPDLPPSLFESDAETAYTLSELRTLISESLPLGAQARFDPQPVKLEWGLQLLRYNRVEGISAGVLATQQLGAGFTLQALARLGTADLEPNLELGGSRTNLHRTLHLNGYNRLVAANDWGNPLNFGSSVGALLFGRDEGFYYRATGAELRGVQGRPFGGMDVEWRLFAERQRPARQRTSISLLGDFRPNIEAERAGFAGAQLRMLGTRGLDPKGLRLFSDIRLEGAGSRVANYGRSSLELSASDALGRYALALTAAAGTTVGSVPPQRLWYLGGTHTVRGQEAGAAVGDAFWFGRGEIGTSFVYARPVVFADIGWAGNRRSFDAVGRPLSGAGIGASFMDGLLRADLSHGIWPQRRLRFDVYLEGRF